MLVWDWARFPVVRSQTQRVPTAVQESNDAESLYLFDALAGSRYTHSVERRDSLPVLYILKTGIPLC